MVNSDSVDRTLFDAQTILLVEDNDDDAFLMQNTFRKAAVRNPVQRVGDGQQALDYLNGEGCFVNRHQFPLPVIIFLDLNMPRKNGLEVLQWIRQQPDLKKITIHVLTASSRPEDVVCAAELAANSYLVKPGRIEELLRMVEDWYSMAHYAAYPAPA